MSPTPRHPYAIAVAAIVAATLLRLALSPILGDHAPFVTFFGAVMVAAWYGGLRPGVLATALATMVTVVLFAVPHFEASGLAGAGLLSTTLFVITGVLMSFAAHRLHLAREGQQREAERLRTVLQSIGDAVVVTDQAGLVMSLNGVAERLTGWSDAEATGHPIEEVYRVAQAEGHDAATDDAAVVLLARDGARHPVDASAAPVLGADGHTNGHVLVFRDVTNRREAEAAVRQSELELSEFVEHANVGLQWLDAAGVVLRANPAQLEMVGLAADGYIGHKVREFHDDPEAIDALLDRVAGGQAIENWPSRLRGRDGSIRHVLVSASGRWDEGRFVYSRCITLDITDRRRAEQARGLLASIVESTDDAVLSKSPEGRILSWNAAAEKMFGYTSDEVIGREVSLLIPADRRAGEAAILARVLEAKRVETFETQRVARNGDVLDLAITLSPIRDEQGRIIGASSIARDIRRRKALEESLRESDRRKDEFLAVLAHELRNPLAPIRSGVAALRLSLPSDPALRRTCEIIERQVRQMSRLLDDLLDVSRITHGKLDLQREHLVLASVVEAALETCRPILDQAGQTVEVGLPPAPVHLTADPVRLSQVLSNLIGNASKYSPRGARIEVLAEEAGPEVVIRVRDHGIGIPPDALPSLFEMFSQVTDARTRVQGGVGIGLALVKGLVELHGGRVSATSAGPGAGSTFEVRLPVATGSGAIEARLDEPAGAADVEPRIRRRVLVVDDNVDGADSLSLVLRGFGCEVRTEYGGVAAIQTAATFRPEVAFLDLGMPDMDGLELAGRLRALPAGHDLMLVAVTGWGQERDRQLTREAGFAEHLVKPVDPLAIRAIVARAPLQP